MTLAHRNALRSSLFLALVSTAAADLSAQQLVGLGYLPGDAFSQASAANHDGSVVVGSSGTAFFENCRAVRRTAGGLQELSGVPGGLNYFPTGVSHNGNVVVGMAFLPDRDFAFRWTPAGGMQDLGMFPGGVFGSEAYGVSADGNVVVGVSDSTTGYRAFRWTPAAGMQDIGFLPGGDYAFATGVSASGNVVVGFGGTAQFEQAFRWTPGQGMRQLAPLPTEPGANAFSVSGNGNVAVGYCGNAAVRWVGNGPAQDLGFADGGSWAVAYCSNGSGSMIGGSGDTGTEQNTAVLWSAATGMVAIGDLLDWLDIDATGWSFGVIAGISSDGSTLVGGGTFLGQEAGFLVRLPCAGNGWHGSVHHHGGHGGHGGHGPNGHHGGHRGH